MARQIDTPPRPIRATVFMVVQDCASQTATVHVRTENGKNRTLDVPYSCVRGAYPIGGSVTATVFA